MTALKLISLAIFTLSFAVGCTLSLTNVSTHGNASDVVDENQTPENSVEIPISPK